MSKDLDPDQVNKTLVLIWVQTIWDDYQPMTKVAAGRKRDNKIAKKFAAN